MDVDVVIYAIDIGDAAMRGGYYTAGVTTEVSVVHTPRASKTVTGEDALMTAVRSLVGTIAAAAPPMGGLAVSASGMMSLVDRPGARARGPFQNSELYVLAPNVDGLKYIPLLERLEAMGFGVPVHVENDINAALHAAHEVPDGICVALGAGLGAAIKRNGLIQHPPGTWSCYEIGHGMRWTLPETLFRRCHCGNNGCLEAVVGGWAMQERYGVAPEHATPDVYTQMRADVIAYLPQAIDGLRRQTGLSHIVLTGKGCFGYSQHSDFLQRMADRCTSINPSLGPIKLELAALEEIAELEGAALAMIKNGLLD